MQNEHVIWYKIILLTYIHNYRYVVRQRKFVNNLFMSTQRARYLNVTILVLLNSTIERNLHCCILCQLSNRHSSHDTTMYIGLRWSASRGPNCSSAWMTYVTCVSAYRANQNKLLKFRTVGIYVKVIYVRLLWSAVLNCAAKMPVGHSIRNV